jgi:hypothetical protein
MTERQRVNTTVMRIELSYSKYNENLSDIERGLLKSSVVVSVKFFEVLHRFENMNFGLVGIFLEKYLTLLRPDIFKFMGSLKFFNIMKNFSGLGDKAFVNVQTVTYMKSKVRRLL